MLIRTSAILCAVKAHGEHGAVVRVLTPDHGLLVGYVQGAHGREMRPILIPANRLMVELRGRTPSQLPALRPELIHSIGPLLSEPLAAVALQWLTGLTAVALPEAHPYPPLYAALDAVVTAIESAPAARGWAKTIVRYELLLLQHLGFALDLETCAVTGRTDDLAYVSPKSGRAVHAAAAGSYIDKLLPLPYFLRHGEAPPAEDQDAWRDMLTGLTLTGHFLNKHIVHDLRQDIAAVRLRLVDRLTNAAG